MHPKPLAQKRHDVVMDMLKSVPPGQRAEARPDAVLTAGRAWLARQGAAHGFQPEGEVAVDGYDRVVIPRETGAPAKFGVLDISGVLAVEDPRGSSLHRPLASVALVPSAVARCSSDGSDDSRAEKCCDGSIRQGDNRWKGRPPG